MILVGEIMKKKDGVLLKVTNKDLELLNQNPENFWEDVSVIEDSAFKNLNDLEKIVIPKSVKKIKRKAFCDCDNLKSVVVSSGCEEIEKAAFYWCQSLKEICINEGITELDSIVCDCHSLEKMNIPGSVKKIEHLIDSGLNNPITIILNEGTEKIASRAFEDMNNLKSIVIPGTVKEIESNAFRNCSYLREVEFKEGLEIIDDYAFEGCSSLKSIRLPNTVKQIKDSAFANCYDLKNVELNEGLELIGDRAFRDVNIKNIIIPSSVKEIKHKAFSHCGELAEVIIEDGVKKIEGSIFYKDRKLETVYVPSSIETESNPFSNFKVKYLHKLNDSTNVLTNNELDAINTNKTYCLENIENTILDFPYYLFLNDDQKLDYYFELASKLKEENIVISLMMFEDNKEGLENFISNKSLKTYKKLLDIMPEDMDENTLRGLCNLSYKMGLFEKEDKIINVNGIDMPVSYCAFSTIKAGLIKGAIKYRRLDIDNINMDYDGYDEEYLKEMVQKVKEYNAMPKISR